MAYKLVSITNQSPPPEAVELLAEYNEALIILVEPNGEGESNIVVYSKLGNRGVLSAYLAELLKKLLKNDAQRHRCACGTAAVDT